MFGVCALAYIVAWFGDEDAGSALQEIENL